MNRYTGMFAVILHAEPFCYRFFVKVCTDNAQSSDNVRRALSDIRLTGNVVKMNPSALTLDYTLCSQNHAVFVRLGKFAQDRLDFVCCVFLGGLYTPACKHLVCMVMMLMIVIMATAGAVLVVIVVVLVMVVMLMALALLIVMVVMLVALALLVMMVMMLVALAILVMMVVMPVALALLVMMMVMVVRLRLKLLYGAFKSHGASDSLCHLLSVKSRPGSCNDNRLGIMLTEQSHSLVDLRLLCTLGVA